MITTIARNTAFAISIVATVLLTGLVAKACYSVSPSANDQWLMTGELENSYYLYEKLSKDGWVNDDVTFEEFDYISTLASQLQTLYPNVRYSLLLSIIAMESRFDRNASNSSAKGLMQLTPAIYGSRMEKFVEEGHLIDLDDLHNPRLNIVTGLDYFSYILEEVNGDEAYALMWYNEGPTHASKSYLDYNRVSIYAQTIIGLSSTIDKMMKAI